MPERLATGLLDTSVVVDLDRLEPALLPIRVAISAITLAELAAGPAATSDVAERARRQDRLQRTEATFDPIPFDVDAARAFGRVFAAVSAVGRRPRSRLADLQIVSIALAQGLPLVTRNPGDLIGLEGLLTVVAI